jgi:hypothetical protein
MICFPATRFPRLDHLPRGHPDLLPSCARSLGAFAPMGPGLQGSQLRDWDVAADHMP